MLIVEDDQLLRGELFALLSDKGCDVHEAADGREALDKIAANRYDVILLDLMLSKNQAAPQGVDLLRRLEATSSDTPVIVMTNKACDQMLWESLEAGRNQVHAVLLKSLITRENILFLLENARRFPQLSNDAARYFSAENDYHIIRGIKSDLHYSAKQYVEYFDDYLAKFKGERVHVSMFSYLDDIVVQFRAYNDRTQTIEWFREYLGFATQFPSLNPVFEKPVSLNETRHIQEELQYQVRQFATEISKTYPYAYNDCITLPVAETETEIFEINTLKITNNAILNAPKPADLAKSFSNLEEEVYHLVGAGRSIEALENIKQFCERRNLKSAQHQTLLMMGRLNAVLMEKSNGYLTHDAFMAEMNRISGFILMNLLIDVEQALFQA